MAVIIADAGPLIALAKINQLDLLQQLFSEVLLTESVKKEVLALQSNDALLIKEAIDNGWLKCVADPTLKTMVSRSLGLGEKTAIEFALQVQEDALLIMDDLLARKIALRHQLNIVGTAMLIYSAENKQLISNADELIEELRLKKYRISQHVIESIKRQLLI
jgi:predicted nucleic acid-binding protein